MREYSQLEIGDIVEVYAKPRIIPYSENEALKQAQQQYYHKLKEEQLRHK